MPCKGESITVDMLKRGLERAQNDEACDGLITRFRDGCEMSLAQIETVRGSLLTFKDVSKKPSIFLADTIGDMHDGRSVLMGQSLFSLSMRWS